MLVGFVCFMFQDLVSFDLHQVGISSSTGYRVHEGNTWRRNSRHCRHCRHCSVPYPSWKRRMTNLASKDNWVLKTTSFLAYYFTVLKSRTLCRAFSVLVTTKVISQVVSQYMLDETISAEARRAVFRTGQTLGVNGMRRMGFSPSMTVSLCYHK